MATVRMPDGALVALPDNPSPELKERIRAKVESIKKQQAAESEAKPAPEAPSETATPASTTTTTTEPLWQPGSTLDPEMRKFDPGGSAHAGKGEAEIIEGIQKQRGTTRLKTTAIRTLGPIVGGTLGAPLGPVGVAAGAALGAAAGDWISQDMEIQTGERTAYNPLRTGVEMVTAGYLSKFDAGKNIMQAAAKGALGNVASDTMVSLSEGNGLPSTFELATSALAGSVMSGVGHNVGVGKARRQALTEITGSREVADSVAEFMGPTMRGKQLELPLSEVPVQQKLPLAAGEAAPPLVGPTLDIGKPGKPKITKEYMATRNRLTDEQLKNQMGFDDTVEGRTFHKIFDQPVPKQEALNLKDADPNTRKPIVEDSLDEATEWEKIKKNAEGRREALVAPLDRDAKFGDMATWTRGMTEFGRPKDVFKRIEQETGLPVYEDYHNLSQAYRQAAQDAVPDYRDAKRAIAHTSEADRNAIFKNFTQGGDISQLPKKLQGKASELWNILDDNLGAYGLSADKYFGEYVPGIARGQSIDELVLAGKAPAAVPRRLKYLAEDIKDGYLSGREPSLVKITSRVIELGHYRDKVGDLAAEVMDKYSNHPGIPDETKAYIGHYVNSLRGGGYDPSARSVAKVFGAVGDRLGLGSDGNEIANKIISASYSGLLGLRPGPLMRNALQSLQTGVPIFGPKAWAAGVKGAFTKEGKEIARANGIIGVENALLEGLGREGIKPSKFERAGRLTMAPYQTVEEFNRTASYLAGRSRFEDALKKVGGEGDRSLNQWKRLADKSDIDMLSLPEQAVLQKMWDGGASMDEIKHIYAQGIVDDTQFMYMKPERAKALQTVGGRMLFGFANWPQSYASYIARLTGQGPVKKRVRNVIRWAGVNATLLEGFSKVGEYFGDEDSISDNAGWTFFGPMFYTGSPIMQTASSTIDAGRKWYQGQMGTEAAVTQIGKQAGSYIPGVSAAQDVVKATNEDTNKEMVGRLLGFKRGRK